MSICRKIYAKNLNKPDLALKYAEQAYALAPENFEANHALYQLYATGGQAKKAEQVLERASKSDNSDPKFWTQLGDLYAWIYLKEDGSSGARPVAEDECRVSQGSRNWGRKTGRRSERWAITLSLPSR